MSRTKETQGDENDKDTKLVHENMYHCSSRPEWAVALVESEKCTRHQGARGIRRREVTHVTAACGAALQTAIARNETGHELTTNVLKDKNTVQTDVERRRRERRALDKEEVYEIVKVEVQVIRRVSLGIDCWRQSQMGWSAANTERARKIASGGIYSGQKFVRIHCSLVADLSADSRKD